MKRPDDIKAFLHNPIPSLHHHPQSQQARVVEVRPPLPRSVPTLTVYEDGRIFPNSTAVELLHDGLCFTPPTPVRPGCTPQLWQVQPGACHAFRQAQKGGHHQLRAAGQCPPPGRYLFTPITGKPDSYALVPTG